MMIPNNPDMVVNRFKFPGDSIMLLGVLTLSQVSQYIAMPALETEDRQKVHLPSNHSLGRQEYGVSH
jgi:hypothetical protein